MALSCARPGKDNLHLLSEEKFAKDFIWWVELYFLIGFWGNRGYLGKWMVVIMVYRIECVNLTSVSRHDVTLNRHNLINTVLLELSELLALKLHAGVVQLWRNFFSSPCWNSKKWKDRTEGEGLDSLKRYFYFLNSYRIMVNTCKAWMNNWRYSWVGRFQ